MVDENSSGFDGSGFKAPNPITPPKPLETSLINLKVKSKQSIQLIQNHLVVLQRSRQSYQKKRPVLELLRSRNAEKLREHLVL